MKRILVVDDDCFATVPIQIGLERQGFEVVVADSGTTGLRAVRDSIFDLAIVDIFMAGMDGLEAIHAMKVLAPRMPIMAISGFKFRGADVRSWYFLGMARELGADRCLQKPFAFEELFDAIGACLEPDRGSSVDLR